MSPTGTASGTGGVAGSFRGTYTHKVDAKGRVSVPAPFRRNIEAGDPAWNPDCGEQPRLILVLGMHENNCLDCYTQADMAALEERALASDDYDVRESFTEHVVANSIELRLDDNGRILLSPALRRALGIEGEAVFVGKLDRFEIWAPAAREAHLSARQSAGDGLGRRDMLRRLMRQKRPGAEG
ncbi:MAG: division/cell wall cluster transcriptional repressor MraZ [Alphaproteobacteria bacterium]|nr:MAG: division/cell wall cluster transcriptional repressor MraZ [Alphaproteobacteria bacterium]